MLSAPIKITKLRDGAHYQAGRFDSASRWYPSDQYDFGTFSQVRSPTRSWPYSYLKHFYTVKYARLLFRQRPLEYLKLQQIDPASPEGEVLIAHHVARRMGINV